MFRCFGCGFLALWPGIEPVQTALEGGVLTTGPPGKFPLVLFSTLLETLLVYQGWITSPDPAIEDVRAVWIEVQTSEFRCPINIWSVPTWVSNVLRAEMCGIAPYPWRRGRHPGHQLGGWGVSGFRGPVPPVSPHTLQKLEGGVDTPPAGRASASHTASSGCVVRHTQNSSFFWPSPLH